MHRVYYFANRPYMIDKQRMHLLLYVLALFYGSDSEDKPTKHIFCLVCKTY